MGWLFAAAGSVFPALPFFLAGSRSGSTSVWHSRERRVSSIRKGRTALDTSIAARRSNAAIQRWLSEGTSLQCATDCARFMRQRIRPPDRGEEKSPVLLQLFSVTALKSLAIPFSETALNRPNLERVRTWRKYNPDQWGAGRLRFAELGLRGRGPICPARKSDQEFGASSFVGVWMNTWRRRGSAAFCGKNFPSAAQADAEMLHPPKLAQKNPASPNQQLTYGPV